jgi:NTP pyrophosphatase (non-canonical NTP hydrolase)
MRGRGKIKNRTKILNDIHQERARQDHLHPQELPLAMRFVTIMEEAGEVAQAMQDEDMKSVYRELIETAATCVRMAEDVLKDDY